MPKRRFTLVIDEKLNDFLENEKWKAHLSKNQLIAKILSEYASQHTDKNEEYSSIEQKDKFHGKERQFNDIR